MGDVADFFSFNREFLGRNFSPKQKEVLGKIWPQNVEEWNVLFHLIILQLGMKAGKNFVLESDCDYTLYFLNALKNKWDYFTKATKRLVPYTEDINFDIGNASAVDAKQAKRAFFAKVRNIIKLTKDPKTGDNWFARYAKLDIRETFGNLNQEAIEFPAEREGQGKIRLYSFNSTASAPEGLHFFRFYFDEPSRAKSKAHYVKAKLVFDLAENNTRASFPGRVGKAFAWSYPNDTDFDLIVDLYERSVKDASVYGVTASTYEFNLSVNKEMFEDAYNNDPIAAARVYECIKPTSSQNLYFPRTYKLKECINEKLDNRVNYVIREISRITEDEKKVQTKHNFTSIEILNILGDDKVRCFGGDYSVNGDRFVLAGGYGKTINPLNMNLFLDDNWTVIDTNIMPVVDIIIIITAISRSHPIDYLAAGNILTQLKKAFPNIHSFNSDRMQNEKLRQELIQKGINSQSYSFSQKQQFHLYTKKRWCVWNNNLEICNDTREEHKIKIGSKLFSPTELWVLEGEKLIRDNEKITHPDQYSKDVQDAVAIVVNDLLKLEATGVSTMGTSLETLTDEQFRELVEKFMDEKYAFAAADMKEEEIIKQVAFKMNLTERDAKKLNDFCKENYQ